MDDPESPASSATDAAPSAVPLYKKLTKAILPQLQNSFSFASPDPYDDLFKAHEHPDSDENSPDSSPKDPSGLHPFEDDIANAIGEERALNYLLSLICSALVYAGINSFAGINLAEKAHHHHHHHGHGHGHGTDREKDEVDTTSVDQADQDAAATTTPSASSTSSASSASSINQLIEHLSRAQLLELDQLDPAVDRAERAQRDVDGALDRDSARSDHKNDQNGPNGLSLRPEPELSVPTTPFQHSVVENLDPHLASEGVLMKLRQGLDRQLAPPMDAKKVSLLVKIADKLQSVFALSDNDYFYANYHVWLILDVLLQGHLYLTREHLLFFAFLPKVHSAYHDNDQENDHDITTAESAGTAGSAASRASDLEIHSGSLGMKTAQYGDSYFATVITHRFWAVLRLETLTIYKSTTDVHFPMFVIDLKAATRVEVLDKDTKPSSPKPPTRSSSNSDSKPDIRLVLDSSSDYDLDTLSMSTQDQEESDHVTGGYWFKLYTKKKNYRFHTDNLYSARQWVNTLTKVIFQLHNSNSRNEVLIKIPIEHVVEYNTKRVFGSASDGDDENAPLSFNVQYVDTADKTLSATRMKRKLREKALSEPAEVLDGIFFLFFSQGEEFYKVFNKIVEFRTRQRKGSVLGSTRLMEKAKSIVRGDSSSVDPNKPMSTLSRDLTVKPGLVEQIANFNGPSVFSRDPTAELLDLTKRCRIKPPKLFKSKLDLDVAPAIQNSDLGLDSIRLPRQLSVNGLRNLNMSFEASKREPEIAETRYRSIGGDANETQAHALEPKVDISIDSQIYGNPLNLSDPTEYNQELEESRKGKMKALGKSFKALAGMSHMWNSSPSHYIEATYKVRNLDLDPYYVADELSREIATKHFQENFSLNKEKVLAASYHSHLQRSIPVYGKLYLGQEELCFRSLIPGVSTKMILSLREIELCYKQKSKLLSGLVLILAQEELFVEFGLAKSRDDFEQMLWQVKSALDHHDVGENRRSQSTPEKHAAKQSAVRLQNARLKLFEDRLTAAIGLDIPLVLEDSPFYKTEIRPNTSFNFTLLTIGSRGDVQPYIALSKGLKKEGHNVTLATHKEFEPWVVQHGIKFKEIAGDPAELMALMVEHGLMSVAFLKEASLKFRLWIAELLDSSWKACQGSDILIESPSAMGGIHIAEALGIPYMRAFTMPWTRTRAYPHAFIVPDQKKGGPYNYLTHVMFENIFWKGISSQVNRWRVEELNLPRTNLFKLQQSKVPFLYNISPTIFPPSVDFPDWVKVTGYWFLDEGQADDYEPPVELTDFLHRAAAENKRVVYIGFGSIVVNDSKGLTQAVVDAVLESGVRCILNKGWTDRLNDAKVEIDLPPEIYNAGSIPHDWLFPQIDAAVHHGGSGTTGATVRAGIPAVIKPFFGDQFFYASRVEDIGIGLALRKLNAKSLLRALHTVTLNTKMIERARKISHKVQKENGVLTAVEAIYSELEYAKNLILAKQQQNEINRLNGYKSGNNTPVVYEKEELEMSDYESNEPPSENIEPSVSEEDGDQEEDLTKPVLGFIGKAD